jgi:RNA polymerase sigma factor (sigma-70 family)
VTPKKEWKELPPMQIERAIRGNRKDLDALVRWYGPVVWAAVAARVRAIPALAVQMEDLVGSVWLELCRNGWKRLGYYDRARGEFGYFIRLQAGQIAWNLVLRQRARPELVQEATLEPRDEGLESQGLESQVLSRDFLERLAHRARAQLSESDWALFNATFVEGLTSEEVATRLERKPKTVYQQRNRLRGKLEALVRELLAEANPEHDGNEPLVGLVVASLITAWLLQGASGAILEDPQPFASTFMNPNP